MEIEDKEKHVNGMLKQMTTYCFETCMNRRKLDVDSQCTARCFKKYVKTLDAMNEIIVELGREKRSEYIKNSVGLEKRDLLFEKAFPDGGSPGYNGPQDDLGRFYKLY